MAVIRYSDNSDDPQSFTQQDMDHLINTYNTTISALIFVLNYTEQSNKHTFERSLMARRLEDFSYYSAHPENKLIYAVGTANALHKQNHANATAPFSSIETSIIRNAVSEYERTYKELEQKVGRLNWAFLTEMIFAYDKLCGEVRKFKSKNKHVIGLAKITAELDKYMALTANAIGAPENEWCTGSMTWDQACVIREKMSANDMPLYPLNMYRDLMRFETVKETIYATKRDKMSRKQRRSTAIELDTTNDKIVELAQANHELAQRVAQLEQEKTQLIADNTKLSTQIAQAQRGFLGKIAFNIAQRLK